MSDEIDPILEMPRGALPTPRHLLAAATPFDPETVTASIPPSALIWPTCLQFWGNDQYGDCVTAEEAFAKACFPYAPEPPIAGLPVCLPDDVVIAWAKAHGYLNGAYLHSVLKTMQTDGFPFKGKTYDDGPYRALNWHDTDALKRAIFSTGPVKIGVGAGNFQRKGAGQVGYVTPGKSGWVIYGYPAGNREDHCVSLCGYGTAVELAALFAKQGVKVNLPGGMPAGTCYALFTWKSIGIIDEQSMLNMTYEAWVRTPVTIVK